MEGGNAAIYCEQHGDDGTENTVQKLCCHVGCSNQACLGDEGDTVFVYCRQHAEDGILNVRRHLSYDGRSNQAVEDGKVNVLGKISSPDAFGNGVTDTSQARSGLDARHSTMCPSLEEYEAESLGVLPCGSKRSLSASGRWLEGDRDRKHSIKRICRAEDVSTTSRSTATAPAKEHRHQGTGWHSVKVETQF